MSSAMSSVRLLSDVRLLDKGHSVQPGVMSGVRLQDDALCPVLDD